MNCSKSNQHKIGYSKPSSQIRAGPAPLASFEDLPTDDQFSEASLIEDLPCVSECLDDRMFHDNGLNRRKVFQRSDTSFSADMNGSLITLTPTCSITPTELGSPTKTLTPVTPINQFNHLNQNQYLNQPNHLFLNSNNNQHIAAGQLIERGGRNHVIRQSFEALKVPLSPSITLNNVDERISDENCQVKPVRKGSWTNFFRSRSKSTGGTSTTKSPTPSSTLTFFSPKQSSNQLNKANETKRKKRRMSSIFSFFSTFKKTARSSLQDLRNKESDLIKGNLLSTTNLDKVVSASSPKVLNYYTDDEIVDLQTDNLHLNEQCNQSSYIRNYIESNKIAIRSECNETNSINLNESFGLQQGVEEFVIAQIAIAVKEKEEFEQKMKEDIYLEEKILDADIPIDKLEKKLNHNKSIRTTDDCDKKEVLLRRTLKDRSDTLDEIRSLPGRLPSFRKKVNHSHANESFKANESSTNADSETDDATTITDQFSPKKANYNKKDENNIEITNLLEDEDTYNELLYKKELHNSPSRLKLQDKNERLNIKIIPIERPRSVTPVNFSTFETFINSSTNREIDQQDKIRLKLPEDAFNELISTNGRKSNSRKSGSRKGSPLIWHEWERGLHTPKYNTRRNSNIDDQTNEKSVEEAFTPSIGNSSTNETISEYLDNLSCQDNGFEDDFVNACLADLANVLHNQQEHIYNHKTDRLEKQQSNDDQLNNEIDLNRQMQTICYEEANYQLDDNELKQTFDRNNNEIVDDEYRCEKCENCKFDRLIRLDEDEQQFTSRTEEDDKFDCKCNCHVEKENFNCSQFPLNAKSNQTATHQRRHSISSDISSASSRLICSSSSSSSSNSSRRISVGDDLSNDR